MRMSKFDFDKATALLWSCKGIKCLSSRHVCSSKKVHNKCFTVFLETLFTFCKTVSSSLTVQSASKEQGNCGLGPRRCSSQQQRRVHGMVRSELW
ncbi:hypothetical protein SADUNF_Sadunf14G0054000 [Salix dunnii]|uniref:Uncharacterized protein n=1 Tax=Salix dunnii TaxID=1413687 RepID=A0A835JEV6_9ROSI|nr:hypothetical protein SADUNF_Sadunf14G0054000 [Salix dunnii]